MTIAIVTIAREIRYTGKFCRTDCPQYNSDFDTCSLFPGNYDNGETELWRGKWDKPPDDEAAAYLRCNACLKKTGDKS